MPTVTLIRAHATLVDSRIKIVVSAVDGEMYASLRTDDLSRSVNLSTSRLRHLFKAEMGQTLAQYRKSVRMKKACVLLTTTFMSVKEIVHSVGVASDSRFACDFKEAYGLSPTQYRIRSRLSGLD